jgi:hypothetical protein
MNETSLEQDMSSIDLANWSDLGTRGFVHVPAFLSEPELQMLHQDYCLPIPGVAVNQNYDVVPVREEMVARFESRLDEISDKVRNAAGIDADVTSGALYFATTRGIAFPWHQDHESYYFYQDHKHYLNFYIPIVKPDVAQSNLCVIPFDDLLSRCSAANRLVGAGASIFAPTGRATVIFDDESERQSMLPIDIESVAVTPQLRAGDLLLLRGDMIHRTQDTNTERVSISFRRLRASNLIRKDRLLSGGPTKQEMLRKNPFEYETILQCFADSRAETVSVGEVLAHLRAKANGEIRKTTAAR